MCIGFLSWFTNPTVIYLLLLLGIYGIFFELINPGHLLPGVLGMISLCIALYTLQLVPINYMGFILMLLGMGFIISETFVPAYGALSGGGTIAFIIGSITLFDTNNQLSQIAWSVICIMAVVNLLIFVTVLGIVIKTKRQAVKNGLALLVGAKGRAFGDINPEGQAIIRGEIWSVQSEEFISADKPIKVIKASGLVLEVKEDLTR